MVVTFTGPSLPYTATMGKPASSGDSLSAKGIQEDLESYGRGYDKIGSRDTVEKLWDWLDEDEHKVLLEHFRRSHTPKYDDVRSILFNVTLDQLLTVINHGVPANNWPTTKFNNRKDLVSCYMSTLWYRGSKTK